MEKLDIWKHGNSICSLQVTLSNGKKSEIFKAGAGSHENQQTLEMSPAVQKVGIRCNSYLYGLKFVDNKNNEISVHDGNVGEWKD